ncbi:hypothetical protein LTR37_010477 [Vermiconidia calcicola]|uniref:Uncharacterized protein n=1 Tax=Vermiconidia calcicola TaxID=1690605 RepID=A0ACC3N7H8_9PEZI|nr:hypothetical protein LTR37_010477 [Vermiconidia calcicola]
MGLPIWRDPEEVKIKKEREQSKSDPTAAARSPIRRRPVYARRRTPPRRETARYPPHFERSSPSSMSFNGLRDSRRGEHRGVPPVSTLLESADRRSGLPPPVPETRNYSEMDALDERERELRDSITNLQGQADRLESEARAIQAGLSPSEWDSMDEPARDAWIEENVPQEPFSSEIILDRRRRRPAADENRDTSGLPRRTPPESLRATTLPSPHGAADSRRATLPTPPHDVSDDHDSLFIPETSTARRSNRGSHPLSRSWHPESPVNGLGDRNRSPTPTDGWEIMRATITPDATLPSADSSFTSAAASQSFTSNDTTITEPERGSFREGREDENQSDTSVDPYDLICNDEERATTAALAEGMYYHDSNCPEGRARISRRYDALARDGHRYALLDESESVEIGFRLIDEALNSAEGRERVYRQARTVDGRGIQIDGNLEERIFAGREDRSASRRTRQAHVMDDEPPSPHPERYSANARAAVRQASDQVHDYFRRFTADSLTSGSVSRDRVTSPPPRYEPVTSHPDVNTFTSRDGPEPNPVSPPSARSERDVADALLSGDEQDLNAVRRVVERLAQRDDVPDEWWMSMGLNLSRTRARSRSPARRQNVGSTSAAAAGRVRNARIERGNSRL